MRLEEEIQAYRADIIRLEEMARELANTEFIAGAVVRIEEDTEELIVPQVKMLYPYSGNNIEVKKDEVSTMLIVLIYWSIFLNWTALSVEIVCLPYDLIHFILY